MHSISHPWRLVAQHLLLGGAYFVLGKLGLMLASINASTSPIWPASGLAMAGLILGGARLAPAVWLAAFAVNAQVSPTLSTALGIATGNTFEALVAAGLYRLIRAHWPQTILVETMAITFGGVGACAVGATGGLLSLTILGGSTLEHMATWFTWWGGDLVGCLFVTPAILEFARGGSWSIEQRRWQWLVFSVASLCLGMLVFGTEPGRSFLISLFLIPLGATILGATRLVHLTTLGIGAVAVATTHMGRGPFNLGSPNDNLIHSQIYLTALAVNAIALIELRAIGRMRIAAVSLALGWLLCGVLAVSFRQGNSAADSRRFKMLAKEAELRIVLRLTRYIEGLIGGVGLFEASNIVTSDEWKAFADTLDFPRRLPGIRGIGTISIVQSSQLDLYLERNRRHGNEITLKSAAGSRAWHGPYHYIIDMIEPRAANASAIGLDVASEINRRNAAELAAETGDAAITAPIQLVQDAIARPGFLLIVPRYSRGAHAFDQATRRASIQGWVYAPVVAGEFFAAALAEMASPGQIELVIEDSDAKAGTLRYASSSSTELVPFFTNHTVAFDRASWHESTLRLGQRTLNAHWWPGRAFIATSDTTHAWALGAGTIVALFVAATFVALEAIKERAEALAADRMAALEVQRAATVNASRLSSLGVMAGGIAHEVNTPLAVIHGRAHLLLSSLATGKIDHEKLKGSLEIILATATRIARVVKGLRSFARSGEQDPMTDCELATIVDESLGLCMERFRNHGVELLVGAIPSAVIRCRSVQITQVLVNLLSNAFDAVSQSEVRRVEVLVEAYPDRIEIAVTDSGPGIPIEVQNRLMEPFFTTKEIGKGTGLGLSISKGLMDDHGGNLAFDSRSSKTRFVVTLPRARESNAAA